MGIFTKKTEANVSVSTDTIQKETKVTTKEKINLFELTQQGLQIQQLFEQLDDESTPEEILNKLQEMDALFTSNLEAKFDQYYKVINNLEFDIDTEFDPVINRLEEQIKKLKAKKLAKLNKVDRLKSFLITSIKALGIKNVKGKLGTFYIKNTESVSDNTVVKIKELISNSEGSEKLKNNLKDYGVLTVKTTEEISKSALKKIAEIETIDVNVLKVKSLIELVSKETLMIK